MRNILNGDISGNAPKGPIKIRLNIHKSTIALEKKPKKKSNKNIINFGYYRLIT